MQTPAPCWQRVGERAVSDKEVKSNRAWRLECEALRAELMATKTNRDYWMAAAQAAQTHRDGANFQISMRETEIERLRARLAEAEAAAKVWNNDAKRRSRQYERCAVALAEAERDTERFDWFFGEADKFPFLHKFPFLQTYMVGVREKWSLAQWRAAIDAAMGESRE